MGHLRRLVYLCLLCCLVTAPLLARADDPDADILDLETDADDDYEEVEEIKGFLVVRKAVPSPPRAVLGQNVTVTVEVYNAGKSSAKSVIIDDTLGPGFQLIEGKTSFSLDSLAPGASSNIVYTMVPTVAGLQFVPAVQVKYISVDDDRSLATSSNPKNLVVLTPTENFIHQSLKVGAYATFGSIQTAEQWLQVAYGAAGIAFVVILFFGYSAARDANKRWKYQRALKEVEKMQ